MLVCISPQYKEDADASQLKDQDLSSINSIQADPHRRRTRYLHRQMQAEYTDNCCKNKRFRPVIFPGALVGHLPTWLKNTTVYHWPNHWEDLCFNLSKPYVIIQNYKHSMTSLSSNSDFSESFDSITMRAIKRETSSPERTDESDRGVNLFDINVRRSDSTSLRSHPDVAVVSVRRSDGVGDIRSPVIVTKKSGSIV